MANLCSKNLKYREAELEYQHHLQQFRMMHRQLQGMNTMQYNVVPAKQLSNDPDYFQPFDNDDDVDLGSIFVEPLESLYSICNEMKLNTSTSVIETDNTFMQMKSFPNVSMNSFDNMNENVYNHDNYDNDDFSVL